jgi:hypothetical protein
MNHKKFLLIGLLASMAAVVFIQKIPITNAAESTTIYVAPKNSYPAIGGSFNVTIRIDNVTNLNAWQIGLTFNPIVLECTGVFIPVNNLFAGYATINPLPAIDNTIGQVVKFLAIESPTIGINGSGNLVLIQFQSKAAGYSALNFTPNHFGTPYGTYLQDNSAQPKSIPFDSIGGLVEAGSPTVFTATKGGQQYNVTIFSNSTQVTAFNFNETTSEIAFNVTGPSGTVGSACAAIPQRLLNGTFSLVIVDGFAAVSSTLDRNSTYIFVYFAYEHSTKRITILVSGSGDINGDRIVDIDDVIIVALAYGSQLGDVRWNPKADLQIDGIIDIDDVILVAIHYGEIYY